MTEQVVKLKENDVIGIVRGISVPWNLVGNYELFVYRLCKYTSENLLTIEIDDDEIYVVSDDDNDSNNVIILDPVDIKVEHDLNIQLSRDFNAEIKQELLEFDEFETYCSVVKKEPSNFFEIETTANDPNEVVAPELDANEAYNPEANQCESNDTTIFSSIHQQDDNRNIEIDIEQAKVTSDVPSTDKTVENDGIFSPIHQQDDANIGTGTGQVIADVIPVENAGLDVEHNLEHAKATVRNNVKRTKGPELIKAKRKEKRFKKDESMKENGSIGSKSSTVNKKQIKEKLKGVSSSAPMKANKMKEKTKTTARVKSTKDNRGAFLTDTSQMPGLPAPVKERRKSTYIAPLSSIPKKENAINGTTNIDGNTVKDIDIDGILSKVVSKNDPLYTNFKVKKLSFNDLQKPKASETNATSSKSPIHQNENTLPKQLDSEPIFYEKMSSPEVKKNSINSNHQGFTGSDIYNVPNGIMEKKKVKHKKNVTELQVNSCHEVISILTSYDAEQFKSVDTFCNSVDTNNVNSFYDTFEDYTEYRG